MKNNFKTIINSEIPVLVAIFAEWCGPCKVLAPILKQVKDELGAGVKTEKYSLNIMYN